MNEKVYIIGAGGHGRVVLDVILSQGDQVIGFIDDNPIVQGHIIEGIPVIGGTEVLKTLNSPLCIIAIGDNFIREKIQKDLEGSVRWHTAIHRTAVISSSVVIGVGTVIMPHTVINSHSKIGEHTIINSGSIVEHDCVIGAFAHIAPRVVLGGMVSIGTRTQAGIGSTFRNGVTICDNCLLGAGSVVVSSIDEEGVYVGVPAKRLIK